MIISGNFDLTRSELMAKINKKPRIKALVILESAEGKSVAYELHCTVDVTEETIFNGVESRKDGSAVVRGKILNAIAEEKNKQLYELWRGK